jgi:hypothetical protein
MRLMLPLFLLLWACTPVSRPGSTEFNPHTEVFAARSAEFAYYPAPRQIVVLTAAILQAGKARRYVILTRVGLAGPNFPKLSGAWREGRALDYERLDTRYGGCIDLCKREEVGVITLSEAEFREAARNGLEFQLAGPRVAYTLVLPASAFAEALALAGD